MQTVALPLPGQERIIPFLPNAPPNVWQRTGIAFGRNEVLWAGGYGFGVQMRIYYDQQTFVQVPLSGLAMVRHLVAREVVAVDVLGENSNGQIAAYLWVENLSTFHIHEGT